MNIQIFGTSKCFDTKKAQRYFKERGIKSQTCQGPPLKKWKNAKAPPAAMSTISIRAAAMYFFITYAHPLIHDFE